jgi:nitrogen fixation NifU-like protein
MDYLDHFTNPKNIGVLPWATGIGESGSPAVANYLQIYLKIQDEVVQEASYMIQGRPQAIAAASYASQFVVGKSTQDLMQLSTDRLRDFFQWPGGLYEPCLMLVVEGIKNAILDHWQRTDNYLQD